MLDLSTVPNNPTALAMVRLFLPHAAIELLANSVTDTFIVTRDELQLGRDRHYHAVTGEEIWLWIAERLAFCLDIKSNIDRAYQQVW